MNQEVQRIKNDAARRAAAVQRLADGAASLADVALLVGGGGLAGVALKQAIKTAVRYCGKDTRCLVGTLGTEIGAEVLAEVSAGGAIASNGLDDIVEKIAAKKAQKTGSAGQNNGTQTANNTGGNGNVGEASKGGVKTTDDLLDGLDPLPSTGGRTTQYQKSGGFDQANADFDALNLNNIREINMPNGGTGRVGELTDGTKVVVRSGSSQNRPGFTSQSTLEIQNPNGATKIRY